MKSFLVGFLLVIFYIFFGTEACSLEGNGQEVVMMSNNTFYNGTVGDNTTWFFLTNFTQIKDLFLSVYLIGYGTSNETQNSAVVQMLVVDDDNHGVGIVTTAIPLGRATSDRRQLFCLNNVQEALCFYSLGTVGVQFSVRAFVMDPRLRNNETEHSFIGNIPHYWFYDFIFNQANNFSQVEVTINANVPNDSRIATLSAVNHSSCSVVVNDFAPSRFYLTWSTRATMILPMYLVTEGVGENQIIRWYFKLLCLECIHDDRKLYNITLTLRPFQYYLTPWMFVVLFPIFCCGVVLSISMLVIKVSNKKSWGDFYDVTKNNVPPVPSQNLNSDNNANTKGSFFTKHAFLCVTILFALFFLVPGVQVVIASYTRLLITGDLDMCYYNELCMIYLGPIPAGNNLMSNMPYFFVGTMLFIFLRFLRYFRLHPPLRLRFMVPSDETILEALTISIVGEGICSMLYHVCPTRANFQLDTAFMFFISGLSIVELYRKYCGHQPHWFVPYFILGVTILANFIGTLFDTETQNKQYKWIFQVGLLSFWFLVIGAVVYWQRQFRPQSLKYIWKWKFGWVLLVIIIVVTYITFGQSDDLANMILFTMVAVCFILMVAYGIASIRCFPCHCGLIRCRQRCPLLAIFYWIFLTFGTTILWVTALYQFYFNGVTDKVKDPAESREMNKKCLESLFNFFDYHDLWHILSSFGLLGQTLILVSLPENIANDDYLEIHKEKFAFPSFTTPLLSESI